MVHGKSAREGNLESFGFEEECATGIRLQAHPSISGLRALVVEDDPDNLEVLLCLLEDEGVELKGADSACAARAVLECWTPDVLLIDLTLPDEDGCAFLQSARAGLIDPAIPAIAMTGHTDPRARARAETGRLSAASREAVRDRRHPRRARALRYRRARRSVVPSRSRAPLRFAAIRWGAGCPWSTMMGQPTPSRMSASCVSRR